MTGRLRREPPTRSGLPMILLVASSEMRCSGGTKLASLRSTDQEATGKFDDRKTGPLLAFNFPVAKSSCKTERETNRRTAFDHQGLNPGLNPDGQPSLKRPGQFRRKRRSRTTPAPTPPSRDAPPAPEGVALRIQPVTTEPGNPRFDPLPTPEM